MLFETDLSVAALEPRGVGSLAAQVGAALRRGLLAPLWRLVLWLTGSWRAGSSSRSLRALQLTPPSCGAPFLHCVWKLPGPGIEHVSPLIVPSEKSLIYFFGRIFCLQRGGWPYREAT